MVKILLSLERFLFMVCEAEYLSAITEEFFQINQLILHRVSIIRILTLQKKAELKLETALV